MAAWMTLFKAVPWVDVIAATPVIARNARKAWTGIREKWHEGDSAPTSVSGRIEALEGQVVELRKDLKSVSEVTSAMAEQNARLVEAVDILRLRTRLLVAACGLLLALSIALGYGVWLA